MKALTLWQPWAQLMVTRAPCDCGAEDPNIINDYEGNPPPCTCGMVKGIETRSWAAPAALIGQRIAIHAAARLPAGPLSSTKVGPWRVWMTGARDVRMSTAPNAPDVVLPLGAVVGSAVLTACVPMCEVLEDPPRDHLTIGTDGRLRMWAYNPVDGQRAWSAYRPEGRPSAGGSNQTDVTDQLPFGHFEAGRWAWIFTDAAPTTERCPACWGDPSYYDVEDLESNTGEIVSHVHIDCRVCAGVGRCEPIPATGGQRIWNWTP